MRITLIQPIARKTFIACHASKLNHARVQLPKQVFPRYLLGSLADDELIQLKLFISDMVYRQLALRICKMLPLGTLLPFALSHGEEAVAVDASVQHVIRNFEQKFELLHE